MAVIRIENLQKRKNGAERIVSATVEGEEVWFSSADADLVLSPEAFLSAFLITAQLNNDRLKTEAAVCKRWLRNSRKLLIVTNGWWKLKAKRPVAAVKPKVRRRRWFRKKALFFTAGVDSFHTLHEYPERIHGLINVQGFDIPLENPQRLAEARRSYQAIAKARAVKLVEVRTNLRLHPYFNKANWELTHGGAMAAVAHLLGGTFHDFILSSSTRAGDPRAWGSSWQIDRRWSSESVSFNSWGEHLARAEKAGVIADQPLVRDHLRVCWQSEDAAANCGTCPKCTRTMVGLAWAGKFEALKHRFTENPPLEEVVATWKPKPIASADELDPVLTEPGYLQEPLRSAVAAHRDALLADLAARNAPHPSTYRRILLSDGSFREMLRLSQGLRVFYHKVAGNVGDDLIHAATMQLFRRFGITLTNDLEEAEQVILCGGGNVGIWENCAEARRAIYQHCETKGIRVILYPQSVGSSDEVIPDIVKHRFVREWASIPLLPGSRLMPDLALAYHVPKDYGKATHARGIFTRNDREGMFPEHPDSTGDPPRMVPRSIDAYFSLAAGYEHIITDRLHFAIASMLLKRKVTLLPNKYHKNRAMWETWLKDLGCGWAESPEEATAPVPQDAPLPLKSTRKGLAMVMCVHNEELLLEANLRYHRALGVDAAYLFLDRCTDRSEEIASRFPWVRVIHRNTPDTPFHIREHQVVCMNDGLEMAREDGFEWLLGIDADEFAFANNKLGKEGLTKKDKRSLDEDQRESPNVRHWARASLRRMLVDIPAHIEQVSLQTCEALPMTLPDPDRFWESDHFLTKGSYPGEVLDPTTGEWRKMDRWLGHNFGKPIIRTSARVQGFNAHFWAKWQNVHPPDLAWHLPVPTIKRGWHSHYYCIEPNVWLKKFRDVARNHEHWPTGTRVEFPKLEWAKAAVHMTLDEARDYLAKGVQIPEKTARKWAKKHPGVMRRPVWAKLLAELMDQRVEPEESEEPG